MRCLPPAAVLLAVLFVALPAWAYMDGEAVQDDSEVKDHPMIPRFPKPIIIDGERKDFEEYGLPVSSP